MAIPTSEIQTLTPGALWVGFKLDLTGIGGSVYFFTPNLNQLKTAVVWAGQAYSPLAIEISGMEETTQGALPHPQLTVSNLSGVVGALVASLGDLTGAIVTRYSVLTKFLDAVNFTGGVNATADPSAGFSSDIWVVEQKTAHTWDSITFDLVALSDAQGLNLPARPMTISGCTWSYKNADGSGLCTYSGGLATCDRGIKTPNGCIAHFGSGVPLPYGAFPGLQMA